VIQAVGARILPRLHTSLTPAHFLPSGLDRSLPRAPPSRRQTPSPTMAPSHARCARYGLDRGKEWGGGPSGDCCQVRTQWIRCIPLRILFPLGPHPSRLPRRRSRREASRRRVHTPHLPDLPIFFFTPSGLDPLFLRRGPVDDDRSRGSAHHEGSQLDRSLFL
jgi:hypothetical protein